MTIVGAAGEEGLLRDLKLERSMPPQFQITGHLMRFEHLDVGAVPLLTVGFRFTDQAGEKWTGRFNRAKARDAAALDAAARTMVTAIANSPQVSSGRVVAIGAISSADTHLDPAAPAAHIGRALSDAQGWEWRPDILSKTAHASLHSISDAATRDATVQGKYVCTQIAGAPGLVVVVDDFCTRGATLTEIARAVSASNPRWSVVGIAMGKTERAAFWNGDISNQHISAELERAWLGT